MIFEGFRSDFDYCHLCYRVGSNWMWCGRECWVVGGGDGGNGGIEAMDVDEDEDEKIVEV